MFDFRIKGQNIEIIRDGKVDRLIPFDKRSDLDDKLFKLKTKLEVREKHILRKEKEVGDKLNRIKSISSKIKVKKPRKPNASGSNNNT